MSEPEQSESRKSISQSSEQVATKKLYQLWLQPINLLSRQLHLWITFLLPHQLSSRAPKNQFPESIWIPSDRPGSRGTIQPVHPCDSSSTHSIHDSIWQHMTGILSSREGSDRITIVDTRAIATMISLWSIAGSRFAESIRSSSTMRNTSRMSAMDTTLVIHRTVRMNSFNQFDRRMIFSWVRKGSPMMLTIGVSYNRISRKSDSILSLFQVTIGTI